MLSAQSACRSRARRHTVWPNCVESRSLVGEGFRRSVGEGSQTLHSLRLGTRPAKAGGMMRSYSFVLVVLALGGVACSAADPITNKWDCHDVCQRYADCVNDNYDVSACQDRCEHDASASDKKQNKLNDCHDCIGENSSCVSDIASCTSSCGTFIAP